MFKMPYYIRLPAKDMKGEKKNGSFKNAPKLYQNQSTIQK